MNVVLSSSLAYARRGEMQQNISRRDVIGGGQSQWGRLAVVVLALGIYWYCYLKCLDLSTQDVNVSSGDCARVDSATGDGRKRVVQQVIANTCEPPG